eukprot:TRINITY_DN6971_c0_g1_i1.p1 TRINITY_DN6971_c0_g1~~TRINITY_DN6971_c0_g1_i1.p1  ORF type:complete len:241 (+),score=66.54 TRINITY_DN6971_c0_g1_i1:3-725(+)
MKSFVVLSAAIALVAAGESGTCLDSAELAYLCTIGTPLGDKLSSAFYGCSDDTMAAGRARKASAGANLYNKKTKKCVNPGQLARNIKQELADELCVFQQLGWLDNNSTVPTFNEEVAMADLAALPAEVSWIGTDDGAGMIHGCIQEKFEKLSTKKNKKCFESYSEKQQAKVAEIGYFYAGVKCFTELFDQACTDYVSYEVYSYFLAKGAPSYSTEYPTTADWTTDYPSTEAWTTGMPAGK